MRNEISDPRHAAVRHILSAPVIRGRTAPHITASGVRWEALLVEATTMSDGERALVEVAFDLWEAGGTVGVSELPRRLDRRNLERVLEALWMSRGELPPADSELHRAA